MIFLLAGVITVTTFAALIAQMSLLLRLKSWNTSEKHPEGARSETGKSSTWQASEEQFSAKSTPQCTTVSERQCSPQVVVFEPNENDMVDTAWWQEVR
jgi:hypothetical protein